MVVAYEKHNDGTHLVRSNLSQENTQGLAFHCPSSPADLAPKAMSPGPLKLLTTYFLDKVLHIQNLTLH